jgi:outer membrane protein assembly factor BamB
VFLFCVVLLPHRLAVHAQDESYSGAAEQGTGTTSPAGEPSYDPLKDYYSSDLFPKYQVETLNRTDGEGDIILPLIHKGSLYAFSLQNRILLWRIFIGGDLLNPFTVRENTVYLYDIYNRVYAIDLSEGTLFWKRYLGSEIKGRLIIFEGFIVAPTLNGSIHFIDRRNGDVSFTYDGEGEINAGPNLYEHLIIVPYRSGRIVAYDIRSRSEAWVFKSGGLISVQPKVRDEQIYFGSWNDTFYALDIFTGELRWSSYVGDTLTREFMVFDSEIILFFSDGETVCLSRNGGEINWVKHFKGVEFNYNYFSGNGKIYVFIPDFIALSPADGEMVLDYRERSFFMYKEMLFDNMVEGVLPISDEERVRLLSERYFTVSSYPYLPPAFARDRFVYFITDSGYLYVYDLIEDFFRLKYQLP